MNAKYFGMTTALLVAGLSSATIAQAGSGHVGSVPNDEDNNQRFESTSDNACEGKTPGSGHVDTTHTNGMETFSFKDLGSLTVQDSEPSPDEIRYLELTRKYLLSTYGSKAEAWPVMIDLANQRVLFLSETSGSCEQLGFNDL